MNYVIYFKSYEVERNRIVIHPEFNPNTLLHDIALLKLPSEVSIQASVQIIPLIPKNDLLVIGETSNSTGWGFSSDAVKELSVNLRFVSQPIVEIAQCEVAFGPTKAQQTHVCVSGAGGRGVW